MSTTQRAKILVSILDNVKLELDLDKSTSQIERALVHAAPLSAEAASKLQRNVYEEGRRLEMLVQRRKSMAGHHAPFSVNVCK